MNRWGWWVGLGWGGVEWVEWGAFGVAALSLLVRYVLIGLIGSIVLLWFDRLALV